MKEELTSPDPAQLKAAMVISLTGILVAASPLIMGDRSAPVPIVPAPAFAQVERDPPVRIGVPAPLPRLRFLEDGGIASVPCIAGASRRSGNRGKLAIAASAGLEDPETVLASLRLARAARESGMLADVVWIACGRAVEVLSTGAKAVQEPMRSQVLAARAAGVRMVACRAAMGNSGVDPERLQGAVDIVPQGTEEISRLIAEGYQLLRY